MEAKKFIILEDGYVMLGPEGQPNGNLFVLYGSLIWPIIECYWIACLYFFKLKNQKPIPIEKFLS
jgi:hypothetical protein